MGVAHMNEKKDTVTTEEVRAYWGKRNIPQQWYSKKTPFTRQWFNELSYKRYDRYYPYLKTESEFEHHRGEEVLEIGCGIGTDLVEFAKGGALVTGTDLGPDQVMLTKLNFDLRGLPYREIKEANAENLPFPNGSFDLVYSIGVIHHVANPEKAVSEIFRVLKPDGKAIVLVYARGWKHYLKRCLVHGILKGRWFKYGFDWRKVRNEVSEVHGASPRTEIWTKSEVRKLFKQFPTLEIKKRRLGEFFEYKPYNTVMFPVFVRNILFLLGFESLVGENWFVKVDKTKWPKEETFFGVWWRHY